jgi:hypothetical protein
MTDVLSEFAESVLIPLWAGSCLKKLSKEIPCDRVDRRVLQKALNLWFSGIPQHFY